MGWRPQTPLDSPRTLEAVERSYQGFRAALARMKVPELMELAAKQGAALESQARSTLFETLGAYHQREVAQPVLSMTPPLPDASGREFDDRASRNSPRPSPPTVPSTSRQPRAGRRLARELARAGLAVSGRRARAEGRIRG